VSEASKEESSEAGQDAQDEDPSSSTAPAYEEKVVMAHCLMFIYSFNMSFAQKVSLLFCV
jgi:hypothetical protein